MGWNGGKKERRRVDGDGGCLLVAVWKKAVQVVGGLGVCSDVTG